MRPLQLTMLALLSLLLAACRNGNAGSTAGGDAAPNSFYDAKAATAATTAGDAHSGQTMYELPAHASDRPEQWLRRKGYTTSYNSHTRNPNWVAWHLTKEHTYGRQKRNQEVFTEDSDVTPRATDADYYNSRYDRGHMCPAGDNKWDATAMSESFLFTNICPQNHNLNKYEWNALEMQCREWARRYGAVDIVCGPLYDGATPGKTIGRGHVWVPDGFFKVVLRRKGEPQAIAFVFRNDGRKVSLKSTVRTVDEVERLTGLDFFTALDDTLEKRIEAKADPDEWQWDELPVTNKTK